MFKRKLYDELKKWKQECNGSRAILVEGARRVGKSTLVKEFAKNEYQSFVLIDFSVVNNELLSVIDDINDVDLFFTRLQAVTGITLYERKSAIVFDEVQLCPKARQAIKHLVADGRYDYIETGSLISIKKNVEKILIPSEERKIELFPMDFEEFCDATGLNYSNLKLLYDWQKPIGDNVNRKLIRDFRMYMAVGGMPQIVDAFLKNKNFAELDRLKQDIINLYKDDLRKIDASGRMSAMYESIPAQLVAKRNRFSFGYGLGKKSRRDEERLFDLIDSKIVNCCYALNDIAPSFNQFTDFSRFKLYVADTGLFVTMLFNDGSPEHEDIYKKLLSDKLDLNLGYLYENIVAQMIVSSKRKLNYFSYRKGESVHLREIDFLLGGNGKVIPLEVKSSKVNEHRSLDCFLSDYSRYVSCGYLISAKDFRKAGSLINLPFYLFPLFLASLH